MRSRSFFTKLDVEKLDIFKPTIDMSKVRILYFAFGSNLLKERLSFSCPSAELNTVARLDNYKLSFFGYSKRWHGAAASIESSAGDHCWGAVWSISDEELVALDKLVTLETTVTINCVCN